jgi:hypothetical protein
LAPPALVTRMCIMTALSRRFARARAQQARRSTRHWHPQIY